MPAAAPAAAPSAAAAAEESEAVRCCCLLRPALWSGNERVAAPRRSPRRRPYSTSSSRRSMLLRSPRSSVKLRPWCQTSPSSRCVLCYRPSSGSGLNVGMRPLLCASPLCRRRSSLSPYLKSSRRVSRKRTRRSSKRRSRTSVPLLHWSKRLPPRMRCIVRAAHTRTRHHRDRTYVVNPRIFYIH